MIARSSDEHALNVIVYDITGKIVERRLNAPANGNFQVGSQLGSGVYIVEVRQGKRKETVKLVKL